MPLCLYPNIVNCFSFVGLISLIKLSQYKRLIFNSYFLLRKTNCSSIPCFEISPASFNKSQRIKISLVKTLFASENVIDFKNSSDIFEFNKIMA